MRSVFNATSSRSRIICSVIILILGALGIAGFVSAKPYPNFIIPGIVVDGIDLGGKTRREAHEILTRAFSPIVQGKLPITVRGEKIIVKLGSDDPSELPIFGIDVDASVAATWRPGHESALGNRIALVQSNLGIDQTIRPSLVLDESALTAALLQAARKHLKDPKNAVVKIKLGSGDPEITFESETVGETLDTETAIRTLRTNPKTVHEKPLEIAVVPKNPDVSLIEAKSAEPMLKAALARAPITIAFQEKSWTLALRELASMLELVKNDRGDINLYLDGAAWDKFIAKLADEVETPVQEAKFRLQDGRVTEFAESHDGVEIDRDALRAALIAKLVSQDEAKVALVVKTVKPTYTTEMANTLGIRERVGRGVTSFAGSPVNRRKNIRIAVERLNGLLITPGEEFSLIAALGPIDGAHGWLQELVIKGNRTLPEFGGGLCQIATTAFRVALAAGAPITERHNHSYRVSYYEPPIGMDATIYEPKPDFKFKNDYPGPLLFTAAIAPDSDHVTFELWGDADGRVTSSSQPVMWNVVRPPEKKIIETSSLVPGKEVCIEKPHAGADAKFTYTVTYPNGRVAKKEFLSHYRPWGAVCLVGTEGAPEITVSDARKADSAAAPPVEQRGIILNP